jgi:hypothetical protein
MEQRTGCRQPLDRGDVSAVSCILYSLSDPGPDRIRKLLRWNPIFGYRRPHVLHSSSIEVHYGFQHSSIKASRPKNTIARKTTSRASGNPRGKRLVLPCIYSAEAKIRTFIEMRCRFPTHDTIVWPNDHGPKPSSDACCSSASVPESRPHHGGEDGQESR